MVASAQAGSEDELTHIDGDGRAVMVDVGDKPATQRSARARARVNVLPATAARIAAGTLKKGDLISVVRLAGIMAAKRTDELVPLAHPLRLDHIDVAVDVDVQAGVVTLESSVRTTGPTGVEIEAMIACSVAAVTVYDMVKAIDRGATIERVEVLEKHGGRSGSYVLAGT